MKSTEKIINLQPVILCGGFRPDIAQATRAAWEQRSTDAKFIRPGKAEVTAIPAESVDYAVMEHCPGSEYPIKMVPLAAGWSDLGAWDAVWQVLPKDEAGTLHADPAINEVSMQ